MDRYDSKKSTGIVRILVVAAGLAMLVVGLLRGDAALVLQRAIVICLGCIGIE
jgi:hypothetical protein